VVFYSGAWIGHYGDKLTGVGVSRVYRSKGPAQVWIDEYIGKVMQAIQSK